MHIAFVAMIFHTWYLYSVSHFLIFLPPHFLQYHLQLFVQIRDGYNSKSVAKIINNQSFIIATVCVFAVLSLRVPLRGNVHWLKSSWWVEVQSAFPLSSSSFPSVIAICVSGPQCNKENASEKWTGSSGFSLTLFVRCNFIIRRRF